MKYSKVAAVVVGSMMAVGVGAPAFADTGSTDTASTIPTSVNGGIAKVLNEEPVHIAQVDSALDTLNRAADSLRGAAAAGTAEGQASPAGQGAAQPAPGGAQLGGLPVGGLAGVIVG